MTRRALLARAGALGVGGIGLGILAACQAPGTSTGGTASAAPSAVASGAATEPAKGGALVAGVFTEFDTLDLHTSTFGVTAIYGHAVYDPLVWLDPSDTKFKPFLADSWDISPDGTQYTFKLKKGVKFHDGTPFNADAVKFTFDRIVDPSIKPGTALNTLGGASYAGTDVVDEFTARVKFKQPSPAFLTAASLTWLGIMSPTAVKKFGKDFGDNPVGTGPFIFRKWTRKESTSFERNPDYSWGPRRKGQAYVDTLTLKWLPDEAARSLALESGDINYNVRIQAQDVKRIRADTKYRVVTGKNPGQPYGFFLNTTKAPFDSLDVRQAVFYAVDRNAILQLDTFGEQPPAFGPLSASTLYYTKKVETLYPRDVNKANQLLDGAGWKKNAGGMREKDGKPLALEMIVTPVQNPIVAALQQSFKEVGIRLDPVNVESASYVAKAASGAHHMETREIPNPDPSVLTIGFHSKNVGTTNWALFKDAKLDAALDKGATTADPTQRAQAYEDAQLAILNNALFYPMEDKQTIAAGKAELTGLALDFRGPLFEDFSFVKK